MGNKKLPANKSRRWFLSGGLLESNNEKVKLLTADGKIVEVDKSVLDAVPKKKVGNKEILQWMKNPSKKDI